MLVFLVSSGDFAPWVARSMTPPTSQGLCSSFCQRYRVLGKNSRPWYNALHPVGKHDSAIFRFALMKNVFTVLIAVWFFVSAVIPVGISQTDVQCPTAEIQSVTFAVRDCCGKLLGFSQRAPKPGDKSFVPCFCAQKKAQAQKAMAPAKAFAFLDVAAPIPIPRVLPNPYFDYSYRDLCGLRRSAPRPLPPA